MYIVIPNCIIISNNHVSSGMWQLQWIALSAKLWNVLMKLNILKFYSILTVILNMELVYMSILRMNNSWKSHC